MKVRLLKNIVESGGIKLTRRRPRGDGTYEVDIAWVVGAEIEMSDASAQKYIERGDAEAVVP
jgi:hypothetical protein